ncbi:MAG TPA: GTPase Era [Candidatus Kryptonia bacterium]
MGAKSKEGKPYRSGYVALIGEPNVGKSTLLNALLGQKLSIVTPKPQTTRHKIAGILTGENYQVVFLDTPGIINPRYALQEVMMSSTEEAIGEADIIVLMVDASGSAAADSLRHSAIVRQLSGEKEKRPVLLALNKVDLVKKSEILPMIQKASEIYPFKDIFPVSAVKGDNLDELKKCLVDYLPEGEQFYPEDYMSDRDERFFVSEIIREEIFKMFREEVPYSTTVEIEEFRDSDTERKTYIRAVIYVEKDSQKGILIGRSGSALKQIGQSSRRQIEKMIGHEIFLELFVKVEKEWRDDAAKIRRLGYR